MLNSPQSTLFPQLYTGKSPFLKANRWFVNALWNASQTCRIESTEDILDSRGFKLWASDQPIVPELLLKLADRELRKPIELCVRAKDPVSEAAIEQQLLDVCSQSPALGAVLRPHLGALHDAIAHWVPNPQQLLSFSVLRHGGVNQLSHAIAVAAFAFALADKLGADPKRKQNLLLAGLLHDVGQLYFEAGGDANSDPETEPEHAVVGALAAVEVTHCSPEIGQLILNSHERIDGSGFPRKPKPAELSPDARILLFAEAMVPHLTTPGRNIWRASVAARLIPGEFDTAMVNWMVSHAQQYSKALAGRLADLKPEQDAGERLRDLHGEMARITVLLSMPAGETEDVQAAVVRWRGMFAPLMTSLRSTGVEEVLALGQNLQPQSDEEAIELQAVWQDLLQRLGSVQRQIQRESRGHAEFETSWLVCEVLRIFRALSVKGV